jgi:eukaryotic-like serine/threonine-protein kinase
MSSKQGSASDPPLIRAGERGTFPLAAGGPLTPADPLPAPAANSSGETVGRYPISGEIARGGMGAILRGHDPNLGRDLAIKVLLTSSDDPDILRRFIEEAQIGGQLQHPGIVPVYEIGTYGDNRPYFTMELVQGRTLAHLLHARTEPSQDLPRFLGIFQQICQTMAYAHSRGVIHRDLKPGNIMVGSFGEVQIMDWGLAKVLPRAGAGTRSGDRTPAPVPEGPALRTVRTETAGSESVAGTVSGTPSYMPPEQARGQAERVGTATDVFALGSILCEILTDHPAYEGNDQKDTYFRALHADLSDTQARLEYCRVDAPLVRLARRCLEPEPEARPHDAGVVADEITAYLNGVQERLRQVELERAATTSRAAAEKRSRRLKTALGGLIALTLLGLALAAGWSYEKHVQLLSEVERDLLAAEAANGKGNWAEARAAYERANGRLGNAGPDPLQHRLRRVDDDLKMVERLDGIRLLQATVVDGHFNHNAALPEYADAFKKFNLDVLTLPTDEAAQRIRASVIRPQLLAALDDCLFLLQGSGQNEWRRVLEIVQQADDDERRLPLREAWATGDGKKLRQLAQPGDIAALPPSTALFVAKALVRAQTLDQAVAVLEAAQREHPADFWLNHHLAFTLHTLTNRLEDAVGYYRAALALRPDSPGVYVNLALVLDRLGRHVEAEDACRKAVALKADYAEAYVNLSLFLRQRDRLEEAEDALQQALALKPQLANAHLNLFYLRQRQGRFDEAEAALRETLRLAPTAAAHTHLGDLLFKKGQYVEAEAEFRKAIELDGELPERQCRLGRTLCEQGRFREGYDLIRKGHERGAAQPDWNLPSEQWLKRFERDAALDDRLPAVLAEGATLKNPAEWLDFARLCQAKKQYAAAVKCYERAFASNPLLVADSRNGGGRGKAARAAILAASGQGVEMLDDAACSRLRQQALAWLRTDVQSWSRGLVTASPTYREEVRLSLETLQRDPALAAVRDETALAKLPPAERDAFRQFWATVSELLRR